jgi:PAS domain S-box-containing protein
VKAFLPSEDQPTVPGAGLAGLIRALASQGPTREARGDPDQQLVALLDTLFDALILADDDGILLDANRAACELFGCAREGLVGRRLADLLTVGHEGVLLSGRVFEQVREQGVLRLPCADGVVRTVECRVEGFWPGRHLLVLRDVTQSGAIQDQFLQCRSLAAVGRLAVGLAHEVTTQLTVITAWVDFLLNQASPWDSSQSILREIQRASDRAAALTRQMTAFGRKPAPVVLDANTVVLDTCKLLCHRLGGDIDLQISLESNPYLVAADPGQFGQVLLNLLLNARDAMPSGGKLTVQTKNVELDEAHCRQHGSGIPGEYLLLVVSDSGRGMEAATRARIFEPFFTTKGPGQASGLGLTTVLDVVKQSNGHVEVDSEPGRGSTFKVYLPRVE